MVHARWADAIMRREGNERFGEGLRLPSVACHRDGIEIGTLAVAITRACSQADLDGSHLLADEVVNQVGGKRPPAVTLGILGNGISPRQLEVLQLIAQGLSTKDIATRLVITPAAVKWHVRAILAKSGAANRAEAVARLLGT
jgi:non-specific serine/threonine protein kinase